MNKQLDIKIANKKALLEESISEFNLKNNDSDSKLISKYTQELKELLEIKSFDFEIEARGREDEAFKPSVLFNGKECESTPLIRLLNDLVGTSSSGKKIKIENTELKEMLRDFDVAKGNKKGLSHKSNSFEIFYKKIFKAVYGERWQEFSKI